MAKAKVKTKRDFGGAGKTDLFTLKTPKAGETRVAANKRAKTWRAKGYAAVVDMLGGANKWGVYVRKSKRKKAKPKAKAKK